RNPSVQRQIIAGEAIEALPENVPETSTEITTGDFSPEIEEIELPDFDPANDVEPGADLPSEPPANDVAPEPGSDLPSEPPANDVAPEPGGDVAPEPGGDIAPEPGGDVAPEPGSDVAPEPGGDITPWPDFTPQPHTRPGKSGEKMLWGGGEEIASIVADVNRWSPQCKRRTN